MINAPNPALPTKKKVRKQILEDIFNDIDFTSSNFEIIDNIIIKLNKRYDIDGVENNILKEYFTSIFKIIKLLKFKKITIRTK